MEDQQKKTIGSLLQQAGWPDLRNGRLEVRAGDGSDRCFVRLSWPTAPTLLAILPGSQPHGLAEARSAFRIGRHLLAAKVPVPEIYGFDEESGILLCQDLGDLLLHEVVRGQGGGDPQVLEYYRQALQGLVTLQLAGAAGFSAAYCWDTPRYDRELMLERESGYFLKACCRDFLGISHFPAGLESELRSLAARAAAAPARFLLHRDFQSRNLMIYQGRLFIIDYQGARFGPLGYDLASLLMDPYANLDGEVQARLFADYLERLGAQLPAALARFPADYYYLYLQRNLQIIGAYAFLTKQRQKVFFRTFLRPALEGLTAHLAREEGAQFPGLREIAAHSLKRLPTEGLAQSHFPGGKP